MGVSLGDLSDFVIATGKKLVYSPERIINDATYAGEYAISMMTRGKDAADVVQSGERLRANLFLTDVNTARFYRTNSELRGAMVNGLTASEYHWRFLADYFTYAQQEISLNAAQYKDPQTFFVNLLKQKRRARTTSTFNKMERALWASPNYTNMEPQSGSDPYSIPVFVNPDTNGVPGGWTGNVVANVDASTNAAWRPTINSYDPDNYEAGSASLPRALDRVWMKAQFEAPDAMGDMKEPVKVQKMSIGTNIDGKELISRLTRDKNDRLATNKNGDGDLGGQLDRLAWNGIPIKYWSVLDSDSPVAASVRWTGSAYATLVSGRPWFYFLNFDYAMAVFHADRYMVEEEPMPHQAQPFSRIVWNDTYYNIVFTSRKRQGLVYAA